MAAKDQEWDICVCVSQELGVTDNPNYKITFMLDSAAMITVHTPKRGVVEVSSWATRTPPSFLAPPASRRVKPQSSHEWGQNSPQSGNKKRRGKKTLSQ